MSQLKGKRVVVTRPKGQVEDFAEKLAAAGATPIRLPVIEIAGMEDNGPLDDALTNLGKYDWLVLTSVNGVQAVWERLEHLALDGIPAGVWIACIGPKTEAALAAKGGAADFVPEEYVAEAILPGLGGLAGKRVLLTRADIARQDLPEAIRAAGGIADDVPAYRTIPAEIDREGIAALRSGVDVISFTSPSTVKNFVAIAGEHGLDAKQLPGSPVTACIGPITAKAAKSFGYGVDIMPDAYTVEGLLDAMVLYFQGGEDGDA